MARPLRPEIVAPAPLARETRGRYVARLAEAVRAQGLPEDEVERAARLILSGSGPADRWVRVWFSIEGDAARVSEPAPAIGQAVPAPVLAAGRDSWLAAEVAAMVG